jgi:hypothetical protein
MTISLETIMIIKEFLIILFQIRKIGQKINLKENINKNDFLKNYVVDTRYALYLLKFEFTK